MFIPKTLLPGAALIFSLVGAYGAPVDPATPRGNLLELHSCELFAGPCVVSSEADVAGNYVLRVWQFDSGKQAGVPLEGLTVALLEKGPKNLAVTENPAQAAVAYLPPGLSTAQRAVLTAWARQNTAARLDAADVRIAPLEVRTDGKQVSFAAGNGIAFSGGVPAVCEVGGCGEALWYQPRSAASSFVVDQLTCSRIVEPALALKWMDHGRRTLFVGRFGDPEPVIPAICGEARTASL